MRHWARCFSFRHEPSIDARNRSAHSPKVGSVAFARSAMGSLPSAIAARHSLALVRALASVIDGYAPSPISRRLPSFAHMNNHDFDPDGVTLR